MAPLLPRTSQLILPFLYPLIYRVHTAQIQKLAIPFLQSRHESTESPHHTSSKRLNPDPDDYSAPTFQDKVTLNLQAGPGGAGCISFLREAYLAEGPPNGGDGGHGGNIYIQAVHGETSLHRLGRTRHHKAGHGKSGRGKSKTGERGQDIVLTVPVGTVIREIERYDPVEEDRILARAERRKEKLLNRARREEEEAAARIRKEEAARRELAMVESEDGSDLEDDEHGLEDEYDGEDESTQEERPRAAKNPNPAAENPFRHKWVLFPGLSQTEAKTLELPKLPRRTVFFTPPKGPVELDLSEPTPRPILLAPGGVGGLGNPHFVSRDFPRPLFATKGEPAMSMKIELELKLLADVGLVGLPNAGKSTLLRALTNSKARVGSWAFTTLKPNIGTVVIDDNKGRPRFNVPLRRVRRRRLSDADVTRHDAWPGLNDEKTKQRTRFTIADIPGLIEGAHMDKGLGMEFLRHVERAGVLAFVVDLSAGDAVKALNALWREVGLYAQMREEERQDRERDARINWGDDPEFGSGFGETTIVADYPSLGDASGGGHIAAKPWFVVATKADLPGTQKNFEELRDHLQGISVGNTPHPSGVEGAWAGECLAIPVSAINGQGVDPVVQWTLGLLDEELDDELDPFRDEEQPVRQLSQG